MKIQRNFFLKFFHRETEFFFFLYTLNLNEKFSITSLSHPFPLSRCIFCFSLLLATFQGLKGDFFFLTAKKIYILAFFCPLISPNATTNSLISSTYPTSELTPHDVNFHISCNLRMH